MDPVCFVFGLGAKNFCWSLRDWMDCNLRLLLFWSTEVDYVTCTVLIHVHGMTYSMTVSILTTLKSNI